MPCRWTLTPRHIRDLRRDPSGSLATRHLMPSAVIRYQNCRAHMDRTSATPAGRVLLQLSVTATDRDHFRLGGAAFFAALRAAGLKPPGATPITSCASFVQAGTSTPFRSSV